MIMITSVMWRDLVHRVDVLEAHLKNLEIVSALHGISAQLTKMETHIMATLDDVLAKVTEESTQDDSIIALLQGLKQQLTDALSGATLPPAVQAKVDAVFDKDSANVTKVSEAISANT